MLRCEMQRTQEMDIETKMVRDSLSQLSVRSHGGGTVKANATGLKFTPIQRLEKIGNGLEALSEGLFGKLRKGSYNSIVNKEDQVVRQAKLMGKDLQDIYHKGNVRVSDRYRTVDGQLERCVIHLMKLNGIIYARNGKFLPFAKKIAGNNPKLKIAILESALGQIFHMALFSEGFTNETFKRVVESAEQVFEVALDTGIDYDKIIRSNSELDSIKGDPDIKKLMYWCYTNLRSISKSKIVRDIVDPSELEAFKKEFTC